MYLRAKRRTQTNVQLRVKFSRRRSTGRAFFDTDCPDPGVERATIKWAFPRAVNTNPFFTVMYAPSHVPESLCTARVNASRPLLKNDEGLLRNGAD